MRALLTQFSALGSKNGSRHTHVLHRETGHWRNSGYMEMRNFYVIWKNGTFENFGGTKESQKNIKSKKSWTFEKFRGTQKFGIFMVSGKNGTFQTFGGTEEYWKNMKSGKIGHSRDSGVYRNSDFCNYPEFSCYPGKREHSKNFGRTFVVSAPHS